MLTKCWLLTIWLIFIFGSSVQARNEYIFEPQEYLIYSTLIDNWYAKDGKELVIRGHTGIYQVGESLEKELSYVGNRITNLLSETIADFKAKNLKSYPLKRFLNQRVGYTLISQEEINDFFAHQYSWERFYQHYPNCGGILTLSRVGFNPNKTQALVHVANQWNRLSGAGLYVLLTRQKDGSWKIKDELRVWRSWNEDKIVCN